MVKRRNSVDLSSAIQQTIRRRFSVWSINPDESPRLRRWDCLMAFLLVWICAVTPYEVAFSSEKNDVWLSEGADPWFWLNRTVDICFCIDIGLQFIIMYPETTPAGTYMVTRPSSIAKHYLKGWFSVDIISVLPFELIGIVVNSQELRRLRLLRVARLMRLLKLVRLLRSVRLVRRWELEMNFSYRYVTLASLFTSVVIASHWMACGLGLLSNIQGEYCVVDNIPSDCVETWFSKFAMEFYEADLEVTAWRFYLVGLHVASTIIVHPHLADIKGDLERFVFVTLIFIGGFVWTRVISRTTAVQTSLDRHTILYRQTMDDLNHMSKQRGLPAELRKRLRSFFVNTKQTSHRETWAHITSKMSPDLQAEVAVELHKAWLRRVPYLSGVSRLFISSLALYIQTSFYAQHELFGQNFTLYILQRGLVSKILNILTPRPCLLRSGGVWGEEHLLLNAWWLLQPNTVRALTFCEVMSLDRHSFQSIRDEHPETEERFKKHFIRYLLVRGIIYTARLRKHELEHDCRRTVSTRKSVERKATLPRLCCNQCGELCKDDQVACFNCQKRLDDNNDDFYAFKRHHDNANRKMRSNANLGSASSSLEKLSDDMVVSRVNLELKGRGAADKRLQSSGSSCEVPQEPPEMPEYPPPPVKDTPATKVPDRHRARTDSTMTPDRITETTTESQMVDASAMAALELRLNARLDEVLQEVRRGKAEAERAEVLRPHQLVYSSEAPRYDDEAFDDFKEAAPYAPKSSCGYLANPRRAGLVGSDTSCCTLSRV